MNKTAIARLLIIEAQEVGQREMSIRRTNSGIAGDIASKITNRQTSNGDPLNYKLLDQSEQAKLLAEALTVEELEYASTVWA